MDTPELRLMSAIRRHAFITALSNEELAKLLLIWSDNLPADSYMSLLYTEVALRLFPTLFEEEASKEP